MRAMQPLESESRARALSDDRSRGGSLQLCADNLPAISAGLATPAYERAKVRAGIVHMGVGGFHRSHQAAYVDRLLHLGLAEDWGIAGVGVLESDRSLHQDLNTQDCLYTLVEKEGHDVYRARVIGSLIEHMYVPTDALAVIERLARRDTRIVTLTITEGGYAIDPVAGTFRVESPDVEHDLLPDATPKSVFGLVVAALGKRRASGEAPFTIVSCDNVPANGRIAREAFTAFAELKDPALAAWMKRETAFPSSMVDRITPATTDQDRDELRVRAGIIDRRPVVCEPFTQWVLEDTFTAGRPEFEEVGVQMVADVEPYELVKLRLLNGSHQALAYFSALLGIVTVDQAISDPLLAHLVRRYMDVEVTPTLAPVDGFDVEHYKQTVLDRFANAAIGDRIERLCAYSSDRIPKFVLPVIRAQLQMRGPVRLGIAVVASWARYAEGVDERGRAIRLVDQRSEALSDSARRWPSDGQAFIRDRELFGDLVDVGRFTNQYDEILRSLHEHGVRRTLEVLVESGDYSS